MTLPLFQLTGSAYEQGVEHGRGLAAQIAHNRDVYFDRFWRESGVAREEVLARAARYAEAIAGQNSAYTAGMQGIADGAALPYLEVVALNVRYEILYYEFMARQVAEAEAATAAGDRDGCTAFALAPAVTASGHLLIGQNWDWIPGVKGALVHTRPNRGLATLAFTEAGIFGGKIGLNEAGLGLVINGMTTVDDDWTRLHKPFHLLCYEILQQRDLATAIQLLSTGERSCSANFLIAQAPDQAVDLEAAPALVNQLDWQDGCLVHANHFVDPDGLGVTEPPDEEYRLYSCKRQERLQTLLVAERSVALGAIQRSLRDHNTAPRHICRHEDLSAPVDEQYRTVTSVIIDLHEGLLYSTDGPPCEDNYILTRFQGDYRKEHHENPSV